MKKKLKISFIFIAVLLLVVAGSFLVYEHLYLPSREDVTTSIIKDNNVLIDNVTFKEKSTLKVLGANERVVTEIELNSDNDKITLEDLPKEKELLTTWEIEKVTKKYDEFYKFDETHFVAKPVYVSSENYVLNFVTDEMGKIFENDKEAAYIKVPYKSDTPLIDYLPEVTTVEDFKGDWFIGDTIVDETTTITEDTTLEFRTYQDKNDNNIDDYTEEFTVSFETNLGQEIPDKTVGWEETIELPELKNAEKVFYDWYLDSDFNELFTEETKVTSDITLHAKNLSINEVVDTSVNQPIKRKDLAIQVENNLDTINKAVDVRYNEEVAKVKAQKEKEEKYNQENNIVPEQRETVTYIHNEGHNKLYIISFVNPSNEYIYSVVAPYGQTIKVTNEKGELRKEYSVRQHTTIVLDENNLVSKGNELDFYHSEYRQVNDTVFIKIQPLVK